MSKYALFSQAEMERRLDTARKLMEAQEIDVLMISGEENFQYFAGTTASLILHTSLTRPSLFLLPLDREPVIVTQGRENLELGSYVTDIRDYDEILRFPHEVLLETLQEITPSNGQIGAELGHEQRMGMPVGSYLDIVSAMNDASFVDAASILKQLRMVKSPEEVALMRQAAEITGRARQRLFEQIRPGMTERQVTRLMRQLVLEEGGDQTSFVILQLDIPGCGNQFNYDRPLEPGTVLAVDGGAMVGMYTIDYARMATLGPATAKQKDVHAKVLEVNQRMIEALKPGRTCSDLHRVGVEAVAEVGLEIYGPLGVAEGGRMGHGQGIMATEQPSIAAADQTVLEPGLVISTEPGVRAGELHYLWEDVHVITETGSEQLTLETPELKELPWT